MRFLGLILAAGLSVGCVARCYADNPMVVSARETVLKNSTFVSLVDRTLTGVTEVGLSIDDLPRTLDPISNEDLRTAVGQRCGSVGLRVVDNHDDGPLLHVRIDGGGWAATGVIYYVSIEIQDRVILTRDMKTATLATVWNSSKAFFGGEKPLTAAAFQKNILAALDKFLLNWMCANGSW